MDPPDGGCGPPTRTASVRAVSFLTGRPGAAASQGGLNAPGHFVTVSKFPDRIAASGGGGIPEFKIEKRL